MVDDGSINKCDDQRWQDEPQADQTQSVWNQSSVESFFIGLDIMTRQQLLFKNLVGLLNHKLRYHRNSKNHPNG